MIQLTILLGTMSALFLYFGIGMLIAKALWPWLRRNKWVIGDWEDWQ